MSVDSLPRIPDTDPLLTSLTHSALMRCPSPELAYTGIDYDKKDVDFTITLPRFRLSGQMDELAGKVLGNLNRTNGSNQ
jgi:hypothetical protein